MQDFVTVLTAMLSSYRHLVNKYNIFITIYCIFLLRAVVAWNQPFDSYSN